MSDLSFATLDFYVRFSDVILFIRRYFRALHKIRNMSVYHRHSEMKVPIRPAPPPPANVNTSQRTAKPSVLRNGSDKVCQGKVSTLVQKKKPPPRPPPPKFSSLKQDKRHIPARPSQLITSLFHRKNSTLKVGEQITKTNTEVNDSRGNNVLSLIDFSSPPSSPTFTTRSSSDALSVNSFGSDGITPCSTSSGNASNVESGFEDDFDLFLGSTKRHDNQIRDPWTLLGPDQTQRPKNSSQSLFTLQNQKPSTKNSSWISPPNSYIAAKNIIDTSAMPTIIRVKPDRPKLPVKEKMTNCVAASNIHVLAEIFENCQQPEVSTGSSLFQQDLNNPDDDDDDDDDGWSSESPPMPTCPPPAPPLAVLQSLLESNKETMGPTGNERSHGIALYDFEGEHPNDLSFKEKDIVNLVRRVDDNWLVGEINGREGTVPANFICVRVPLPGEGSSFTERHVTALYAFRPETEDDLEFEDGSAIKVLGRINQDWLYGECNGRTGQFPANFVDRVPPDLPLRKN